MKENRSRNVIKKRKLFFVILGIVLSFFCFNNLWFIYNLVKLNDIENLVRLVIAIIIVIINILLVVFSIGRIIKKKKVKLLFGIIFVIFGIVLFLNYNFYKLYNILNNVSNNYLEYSLVLVTRSDNEASSIDDIDNKIGVIGDEDVENGYNFAKEIVENNSISYELVKYDNYLDIIGALYSNDLEYAFLPENYALMVSQNEEYSDISEFLKVLMTKTKEVEVELVKSDIAEPFSVLLTGVDTFESSYNADTLMVITFNPKTLKATVLSVPRDTYTKIACVNAKHKINSSGWYSDRCVINTVSNLLNVKIDYFVKVNFVGIVDIVNSLGGIDVDVVYSFCEQDSKRRFGPHTIYVEEGLQTLDGEQALALSRNRHFWPEHCSAKYNSKGYYDNNLRNDITRGLNQQLVIKGILNKISKIDSLDKIYDLLDVIGNNISTNIDKNTMLSFYNLLKMMVVNSGVNNVDNMVNIQKLELAYYDKKINISGLDLYMLIAHQNSIDAVSKVMNDNLSNKNISGVKELSFDINDPYVDKSFGKGITGGTVINTLANFVGKSKGDVDSYCSSYKLNCRFEEVDITDGSFTNGQVISQSINANYDISLIGNKEILIKVAKVESEEVFSYALCKNERYKSDSRCIIPDFINKSYSSFKNWYNKFSYLTVKLEEVNDNGLDEVVIEQSLFGLSIYEYLNNSNQLIIKYNKLNKISKNETENDDVIVNPEEEKDNIENVENNNEVDDRVEEEDSLKDEEVGE